MILVVVTEHTIHDGDHYGGLFIAYMLGPGGLKLLIDHDSGFRAGVAPCIRDFEDRRPAILGVGEAFCVPLCLEPVDELCRSATGENQTVGNIGHTQRLFGHGEMKQRLVVGEEKPGRFLEMLLDDRLYQEGGMQSVCCRLSPEWLFVLLSHQHPFLQRLFAWYIVYQQTILVKHMKDLQDLYRSPGGRVFGIVWVGQLASNLGSAMTSFGLAIWVYQQTGSATQLALIVLASRLPMLFVSPFVGALVDRWDRRWAMILSDTGAALGTLVTMVLLLTGNLEIWHLYVTLAFSGIFQAFQFPAYSAATTLLVPKEHYARASGLVQLAGSIGRVAAPTIAAVVVVGSGLTLLFVADFVTFVIAVGTLLFVRFPRAEPTERRGTGVRGLLLEAKEGLDFVLQRRALLILMLSFVVVNFAFAFQGVLLIPLLLNLASEQVAGVVVSIGAVAVVVGSVGLSVWGGPKNRIAGVYVPIMAMGVGLVLMGIQPMVGLVIAGIMLMFGTHPIAGGSSQAIWQSKVPPNLQGRVFAIRQVSAIASAPIAFLSAGFLADRFFEPLMADTDGLLGDLFGSGAGRGIGLMFVLAGLFAIATAVIALRHPRIKNLETEVPDLELETVAA